jgi:hypothetical protein
MLEALDASDRTLSSLSTSGPDTKARRLHQNREPKILEIENQTQNELGNTIIERGQKNIHRDKEPIICYLEFQNRYTIGCSLLIMQILSPSHLYSL